MKLTDNLKQGIGYIQLADKGYKFPRWGEAAITVKKEKPTISDVKKQV